MYLHKQAPSLYVLQVFTFLFCSVNFAIGQDLCVANDSFLYAQDLVVFVPNDNLFKITFEQSSLTASSMLAENFKLIYNKYSANIMLLNPNLIAMKDIKLYNISGKQVINIEFTALEAKHSFSVNAVSSGTYIATIETLSHGVFSKKIVVNNRQ